MFVHVHALDIMLQHWSDGHRGVSGIVDEFRCFIFYGKVSAVLHGVTGLP